MRVQEEIDSVKIDEWINYQKRSIGMRIKHESTGSNRQR